MIEIKKINLKALISGVIISIFLSNILYFTGLIISMIHIISTLFGGLIAGKISKYGEWKYGLGVATIYLAIHVPLNFIFTPIIQNIESIIIPFYIIGYILGAIPVTIPSGIIGGYIGSKL